MHFSVTSSLKGDTNYKTELKYIVLVMLITGGVNDGHEVLSSTEVYDPSGRTCKVSDMTKPRGGYAMTGRLVCGDESCEKLDDRGRWKQTHKLKKKRGGHGIWTAEFEVGVCETYTAYQTFVFGGKNPNNSETLFTEELNDFGTTWNRWKLQSEIEKNYGFGYSLLVVLCSISIS